jgi:hypothetical protein
MKSLSWKYKIGTIVYSSPTIADSRKATSGRVESFIKGLVSSKHTTYQISNILVICKAFGHQLYMNKSPCYVEPKCEPDSGKAHGRGLYHVECPT